MAITFKTEGVILKCRDYKEHDRLYTIYTKDHGKLVLRAQGVRKINSKLAGHLEPLNKSELFIAQAKGFDIIGGSKCINAHKIIKKELIKLEIINSCIVIFNNLLLDEHKDKEVYSLLVSYLSWYDTNKNNSLVTMSFIIKLLNHLGYQPDYSQSTSDLAKVLNFLSQDKWSNIEKLRLESNLWKQLKIIFNNSLKLHLSMNLQTVNFPL